MKKYIIMLGLILFQCEKDIGSLINPEYIQIDQNFVPKATLCRWKYNKKSAYTIEFDDARESHYEISWPELKLRGMKGTFNLNTKNITSWKEWKKLLDEGNEIASHTWSHPRLTELSEDELRIEFSNSIRDILTNIPDIKEIISLSYPYGDYNSTVRKIALDYFICARGGYGINEENIDLSEIKGIGAYPPYDMGSYNEFVLQSIRSKGWLVSYFHSVNNTGISDDSNIPIEKFREHLDFVIKNSDSLWIAPFGQVVKYIINSKNGNMNYSQYDSKTLYILYTNSNEKIFKHDPVTVKVNIPQNWRKKTIYYETSNQIFYPIIGNEEGILLNIECNQLYKVYCVGEK